MSRRRGRKSRQNEYPINESDEASSQRGPCETSNEANGGGVSQSLQISLEDVNASYQPPPNENFPNLDNEDKNEGDVPKPEDEENDEDQDDGMPQQPQYECMREDKGVQCDIPVIPPRFPTRREKIIIIVAVLSLLFIGTLIWLSGSDWSSNNCMERCKMDKDELYNEKETCEIKRRNDQDKFNYTEYKRNTTIKSLEYQQNETQKAYMQCMKELEQKNKEHERCKEDYKLCIDSKETYINRCREDQEQLKKEHKSCKENLKLCEATKEEYAMSHDMCKKEIRSQYIELERCKTHLNGISKDCQRLKAGSYSATSSSSIRIIIILIISVIFV